MLSGGAPCCVPPLGPAVPPCDREDANWMMGLGKELLQAQETLNAPLATAAIKKL